jgi:hypothetical protein
VVVVSVVVTFQESGFGPTACIGSMSSGLERRAQTS